MITMLNWLLLPFLAATILIGMHVYLGGHVIRRGVIFIDLAIAQLAVLGAIWALILGLHGWVATLISLGSALGGSLLVSGISQDKMRPVPQEAIIGIVYALAAAATLLLLEKAPAYAHEIQGMLAGNILFVQWPQILKMATLYAVVGGVLFRFRNAIREPLFYAAIALVVTSSVAIAGVLMVFSYLTMPAVAAMWQVDSEKARLWLGWAIGMVATVSGMIVSVWQDWPTGPAIIVMLGLSVGISALIRLARHRVA